MNDYRIKATKEEAVCLLIRTFAQFYYTFDNLNRRAINTSPETGLVVLIHNILTDAFSLNRIRPNRNVELKIYELFYDDLMEINDDEINELLQQCYELAIKYNMQAEFELKEMLVTEEVQITEFVINDDIKRLINDIAKILADKELGFVIYTLSEWLKKIGKTQEREMLLKIGSDLDKINKSISYAGLSRLS